MGFIEFYNKDDKELVYKHKDEYELDGRALYLDVLSGNSSRGGPRGGGRGGARGGRGGARGGRQPCKCDVT